MILLHAYFWSVVCLLLRSSWSGIGLFVVCWTSGSSLARICLCVNWSGSGSESASASVSSAAVVIVALSRMMRMWKKKKMLMTIVVAVEVVVVVEAKDFVGIGSRNRKRGFGRGRRSGGLVVMPFSRMDLVFKWIVFVRLFRWRWEGRRDKYREVREPYGRIRSLMIWTFSKWMDEEMDDINSFQNKRYRFRCEC